MSMEVTAWTSLHHAMNAQDERPLSRATLKRIAQFARPHRSLIIRFLLLSVVTAVLTVAAPVLAGRVVDAIVDGADSGVVIRLAVLIAVIALAEAGLGLVTRFLSASIGEGLIVQLRTAVFDHVQRMPVAFFTRTRTGALVSRLNNDVIGAQRAFSDTLSSVVGNAVTLTLTLAVMLTFSWQITLLALVLLPIFVLPARRMGSRLAQLQREAAEHNAAMSTRMTERFSAPGATLVKLYGRPAEESAEFAARARRVRDIGIRAAMLQWVFITALTVVGSLALALVYGLGGLYALRGSLDAGTVVALALLLSRLYAPLTSLASARVEVMSALVSFERVFEVLDLKPLILDRSDARPLPEGPVAVEFDGVRFGYPSADKVSLASLEDVAKLDTRGGEEVLHGVSFRAEAGQMVALVGSSGAGKSTIAQLVPRLYDVEDGAVKLADVDVRELSAESIRSGVGRGDPGRAPLPREHPRQPGVRPAGRDRGRDVGGAAAGPTRRPDPLPPRWAGHRRRRTRIPAVRRGTATAHHRATAAGPSARGHPRRSHRASRLHLGGGGSGRPRRGPDRSDERGHRPPTLHHPGGRPDPRRRGRTDRRTRAAQ